MAHTARLLSNMATGALCVNEIFTPLSACHIISFCSQGGQRADTQMQTNGFVVSVSFEQMFVLDHNLITPLTIYIKKTDQKMVNCVIFYYFPGLDVIVRLFL